MEAEWAKYDRLGGYSGRYGTDDGGYILGAYLFPQMVGMGRFEETAARGTSFGAPSPLELELAALVQAALPSVELVRFVSSGTEATTCRSGAWTRPSV